MRFKDLLDPVGVARRTTHVEAISTFISMSSEGATASSDRGLHGRTHVDRLVMHDDLVAVQARREEDLLGDLAEPCRLCRDHLDQLAPLLRRDVLPAQQRLSRAVDGGHRRAQLVEIVATKSVFSSSSRVSAVTSRNA